MTDPQMRVAVDAHTVGRRATGNETYVRGLLGALASGSDVDLIVLLDALAELPSLDPNTIRRFRVRHPLLRLLSDLATPGRHWQSHLLHVQYVRPPLCDVPCVTTIHDISFERFPTLFTRRSLARMRATIPWSARHSRVVLTGSEFSRVDLIQRYRLASERVCVTPYAADDRFLPQGPERIDDVLRRLGLPSNYLLSVGNLQPRKNLARLLDAYVQLRGERPPLVIVGQPAWLHHDIFETVRRNSLEEAVYFTGYVEADDLPALYSGALVFAYPSLFEGFGLPVLEAMACGAPTLSSQSSSIPEVAGDAAILIDPNDVEAIADGLQRLLDSTELRAALQERGPRQASRFSWAECAQKTTTAYRMALS